MNTKQSITSNRAAAPSALEAARNIAIETENRRERAMAMGWASIAAIGLVAAIGLIEGCAHDRTSVSSEASTSSSATQQAVVASTGPLAQDGGSGSQPAGTPVEGRSLPPDLVATVSDTFVQPGQPVEVTVQGTPDVVEMALSDGRGDPLPMVRDSLDNTWRGDYRVPLKPRQNRIGLSVTAKNEQHQWARVWCFLTVDDGKQQVESVPDTTSNE